MAEDEAVRFTVENHIKSLRNLALRGVISEEDHDTIGRIMCDHIGHLIGLSDQAWRAFTQIVNESRRVHYARIQRNRSANDHQ